MHQGINIYLPPDHVGYPPLWPLWCDVAYRVYLSSNNLELWRFTIKLPLILAHLALAFAVGEFAFSRFDHKTARRVLFAVLTFSFFIFIGAIWGQLNTLSALLTFLAFYALTQGRTSLSAVLLGAAVTLKIYPLITLPAFVIYILKSKDGREAGKYVLYTTVIPVLFTGALFSFFQWDILPLYQTIFYWAPITGTAPAQIGGGCMNIWSFASLFNVDIAQIWWLRLMWVPAMAATTIYWLNKPKMESENLCLSLVSFYFLFIITYAWATEQMLTDSLPFVLLLVTAYRPRRLYLYLLTVVQILVYAFSAVNWGPFVFTPFLERFSPGVLTAILPFNPSNSTIWVVRGFLGLAVSLALGIFLLMLAKPSLVEIIRGKSRRRSEPKGVPHIIQTTQESQLDSNKQS